MNEWNNHFNNELQDAMLDTQRTNVIKSTWHVIIHFYIRTIKKIDMAQNRRNMTQMAASDHIQWSQRVINIKMYAAAAAATAVLFCASDCSPCSSLSTVDWKFIAAYCKHSLNSSASKRWDKCEGAWSDGFILAQKVLTFDVKIDGIIKYIWNISLKEKKM